MEPDAIVIGAGQAGLATAYHLRRLGVRGLVLERGRIGETWRSQRWDSFRLNTPRWMNALPGAPYEGPDPGFYPGADELVAWFEDYARRFDLPVRTGVEVTRVVPGSGGFRVRVREDGRQEELAARHVVVAAGILRAPRIPRLSADLPADLLQLPGSDFRSAAGLPAGAVLVVGGGQSGCQIAEDLVAAGRTVHLCTSRVGRIPRRHRGRDILDWWEAMHVWDVRPGELEDPSIMRAAQALASGIGGYGHTMSLQCLARKGVRLLGRAVAADGDTLVLDDSLPATVRFADERSAAVRREIDAFLARSAIEAPPSDPDPDDEPEPGLGEDAPARLDLRAAGIRTVIWCTGYTGDFSWIDAAVTDADGRPMHRDGVSAVPGLYFVGFPWLSRRGSGIVHGVGPDAERIARTIAGAIAPRTGDRPRVDPVPGVP